ncbi:gamma-glutamyl kinase [Peptococcaceae bacterium SCADC1_2_3]|nr:gamma-glutamyl kinase [Peptococcaceae bacterium SCADC1_2_3]
MTEKRDFTKVNRLVVKVGSSSLIYPTGRPKLTEIEHLVRQLADLHNQGREVMLVTSGAIGMGVNKLGYLRHPKTIPEKQAAAAVGQGALLNLYAKFFAEYGVTVGQVLLTREDFADRKRFLNISNTLCTLLHIGVIPIINENDTVAIEEIKFGDNDNLAALVAGLADAGLLILLSDVDGLYTADPRRSAKACFVSEVKEITPEVEQLAGGVGMALGSGGMATKLQAAQITMHSGIITVLALAGEKNVIRRIMDGEKLGTVFWPTGRLENKKRWIAYNTLLQGKIQVDAGAAEAISKKGKSLLPSGVLGVEGDFEIGNTVSVIDPAGKEIARGIVNFTAREVELIKGIQTKKISHILGHKDYEEIIHRNNLVIR